MIIQDRPDPGLHSDFAKGKGTGQNHLFFRAAIDKGVGIRFLFVHAHTADYLLVTGKLRVPGKEYISRPHKGMEPVYGQKHIGQKLPPVILSL